MPDAHVSSLTPTFSAEVEQGNLLVSFLSPSPSFLSAIHQCRLLSLPLLFNVARRCRADVLSRVPAMCLTEKMCQRSSIQA